MSGGTGDWEANLDFVEHLDEAPGLTGEEAGLQAIALDDSVEVSPAPAPEGDVGGPDPLRKAPGSTVWVLPRAEAEAACVAAGVKWNSMRQKRAGTAAELVEWTPDGCCRLKWEDTILGRVDTVVLKMPVGCVTDVPPQATSTQAAVPQPASDEWTAADDARLATLVGSTATLGLGKQERWAKIATELGGGRDAQWVRQRWAERMPEQSGVGSQAYRQLAVSQSQTVQQQLQAAARPTTPGGASSAQAAVSKVEIEANPAEARGPDGWSVEDCRQLGRLVRLFESDTPDRRPSDAQNRGIGVTGPSQPATGVGAIRADRWESIAGAFSGGGGGGGGEKQKPRFSGRQCRACWLEHLQPDLPTAALETLVSAQVTGSRETTPASVGPISEWSGGSYTVYRVQAGTSLGRGRVEGSLITERRYSEFETFHETVIAPLLLGRAREMGGLVLALPSKSANWSKNSSQVVSVRQKGLGEYLAAVAALGRRIHSAQVDIALMEFVSPGVYPPPPDIFAPAPLANAPKTDTLWDVSGVWIHAVKVRPAPHAPHALLL